MNYKNAWVISLVMLCCSCERKQMVDVIYYHANVYCGDDKMNLMQAFAVKDGKFVYAGTDNEVLEKYDAKRKRIYRARMCILVLMMRTPTFTDWESTGKRLI